MRCWEKFKATMKPTDDKDYKRRMTRGFVAIVLFSFILQWSGLAVGSHPGGQYSRIFGIIEFDDRIERVDPSKVQFVDETHNFLHIMTDDISHAN